MEHFERRTYASSARTMLLAAGCLAGSCLLAACGGGATHTHRVGPIMRTAEVETEAAPVTSAQHAHGDNQASARMGSPGGDLALANGARLVVPAGALDADVEVMLGLGEPVTAFNNHDDEKIVGPSLVIAPELASANSAPFVVELPFTSLPEGFTEADIAVAFESTDDDASGFRGGAVRTTWEHAPARITADHKLRAEFVHAPGMRVQFVVSN